MKPRHEDEPAGRRIEAEHDAIRTLLAWIRGELDRYLRDRRVVGRGTVLLEFLRSFRRHLVRHFQFEEACGVFEQVSAESHEGRGKLAKLHREHREFELRLDRIIDALERSAMPGRRLPSSFEPELRSLLLELGRHEAWERTFFQKVLSWEFGRR